MIMFYNSEYNSPELYYDHISQRDYAAYNIINKLIYTNTLYVCTYIYVCLRAHACVRV